ncbi:MAG: hypothetical protein R2705_03850 [Ilumatobacteraceae bacterium]
MTATTASASLPAVWSIGRARRIPLADVTAGAPSTKVEVAPYDGGRCACR